MRTWGVSEGGGGMTSSMANTRSMENISGQGTPPMNRRRNYRETHVGVANGRPHYRYVYVYMGATMQCVAKNNYEFKNLFLCAVTLILATKCMMFMYSTMHVCVCVCVCGCYSLTEPMRFDQVFRH